MCAAVRTLHYAVARRRRGREGAQKQSVGVAGVQKAVKEIKKRKNTITTHKHTHTHIQWERGNKLQNYMRCAHISGSCHKTVKSTGELHGEGGEGSGWDMAELEAAYQFHLRGTLSLPLELPTILEESRIAMKSGNNKQYAMRSHRHWVVWTARYSVVCWWNGGRKQLID